MHELFTEGKKSFQLLKLLYRRFKNLQMLKYGIELYTKLNENSLRKKTCPHEAKLQEMTLFYLNSKNTFHFLGLANSRMFHWPKAEFAGISSKSILPLSIL